MSYGQSKDSCNTAQLNLHVILPKQLISDPIESIDFNYVPARSNWIPARTHYKMLHPSLLYSDVPLWRPLFRSMFGVRGVAERDILSLCVMGWRLDSSGNSSTVVAAAVTVAVTPKEVSFWILGSLSFSVFSFLKIGASSFLVFPRFRNLVVPEDLTFSRS